LDSILVFPQLTCGLVGRFIMDMLHATGGSGNLPTSYTTAVGSAEVGNPSNDSNWPSIIHALATTAAFILLMPAGIVLLRVVPESVRWHWVNQTFALGLAAIGGAIGLYLSSMFNRSESYNSPHQILGLVSIALLFVQWALGFWHHRVYKKTRQGTKYGPIHRWLGRGVMVLAVVTGGIGLTWSFASTRVVVGYVIAVGVVFVAAIVSLMGKRWIIRKRRMLGGGNNNWSHRRYSESQVHLTDYPDPTGTVKAGRLGLRDMDYPVD
jgi:small-conductance mechanosensitive channel